MQAPGLFDTADKRGKYGLVHNLGLGGAVVVSLLRRPEFWNEGGNDGRSRLVWSRWRIFLHTPQTFPYYNSFRLGYNHASELRPITKEDIDKVKSKKNSSQYILSFAKLW